MDKGGEKGDNGAKVPAREKDMVFEDIIAVIERTLKVELAVVQGTTVFEVAGEDGGRV